MLKRLYARAYIVMMSVAFVIFAITSFMYNRSSLREFFVWTVWILFVGSQIIRFKYLRCPYCRKFTVIPQWSKSGTRECSNCYKVFEYDK